MRLKCTNCNKITTFDKLPDHQSYKCDQFILVGKAYKCSECGEIQVCCEKIKLR